MKDGKAVGLDNVPNVFYCKSSFIILVFLSLMSNCSLIHEFLPEAVTDAKIMLLLKWKLLDFSISDNYRPIAVSTSF